MTFLTVDLYKDFQCIGSACPDTCCKGWIINIDEETYRKMEENEEILDALASEWIMKKDDNRIIKLNNLRCPMLDEDNLCKVVRRLGPEYLSKTCASYPRIQAQYGNIIEGHLSLSCPEVVARLMNKKEIQFDFTEDKMLSEKPYSYEQLYLYEANVRSVMVEIFQNSIDISLYTRVAVMLDILEIAIELYKGGQPDFEKFKKNISWCFQDNTLYMMDMGLRGIINEDSRYHFLQKNAAPLEDCSCSEHFSELIRQVNEYFARNALNQYLSDVQSFKNSQYLYRDFHIKYWEYRIFSDIISIPDYERAKKSFMYIAAGFCLAQIMAMVVHVNRGTLDRDEYIYIISNISRCMEHSTAFKEKLLSWMDENNVNDLAGILLMII